MIFIRKYVFENVTFLLRRYDVFAQKYDSFEEMNYSLRKYDVGDQNNHFYMWRAGMVVIRVEQGCDPARIKPNLPYFIYDRINKIANANIADHRSNTFCF